MFLFPLPGAPSSSLSMEKMAGTVVQQTGFTLNYHIPCPLLVPCPMFSRKHQKQLQGVHFAIWTTDAAEQWGIQDALNILESCLAECRERPIAEEEISEALIPSSVIEARAPKPSPGSSRQPYSCLIQSSDTIRLRQPFTNCVSSFAHPLFPNPLPALFFRIELTQTHPKIYSALSHEAMT
jgi:hypothetical protein